ncbi:gephyrin-like isoform X2 [Adelges cooleyi]|uniref:gephyrin-like isoform X2 n=1 Tax=Adelges cooleyi TaxID=133065 RepID=UPI00217FB9F8|nr:gephyrin-like isoform X2 [Adelges cooleyi]
MDSNERIKVGILTVSDTRTYKTDSNALNFDYSGQNLKDLINIHNLIDSAIVVKYECVIDDYEKIRTQMLDWCCSGKIDVLLSTGGTGLSSRDVTPEATLSVVQKLTPGITQSIINESLKITPMAMLSRPVSGVFEHTLIINLPGSKKASEECLRIVAKVIPHAVSLIKNENDITNNFHNNIEKNSCAQLSTLPECLTKIASRCRESPFPKISIELALNLLQEHSYNNYIKNKTTKTKYPRVWIISTGDELKSNENASLGYIRDTNSSMIEDILCHDRFFNVCCRNIIKDNWFDLCKEFESGFSEADIIITSGGVSMGEKDLIKHVLKEHFQADIHFGRVNLKPGLPTTFATVLYNNKVKFVFCLPGNPVSAGVCTHIFVLPFLRSAINRNNIFHNFKAKLTHHISNLDVRPEFKRAALKYKNGELTVSCLTDHQQSSRLMSFVGSNCLLQLPSSTVQVNIEAGTVCDVILTNNVESIYTAMSLQNSNFLSIDKILKIQDLVRFKTHEGLASVQEVLDLIEINYCTESTEIPIELARDHVLCSTIYSPENLPPFLASIKDGYAINYDNDSTWFEGNKNVYKVVQISVAGTEPNEQIMLHVKECARISTGAPVPPGANCVVQVEDTTIVSKSSDETVEISIAVLKKPKLYDNIRRIGLDIALGQELLKKNTLLDPFSKALLKSVGYTNLPVYKWFDVQNRIYEYENSDIDVVIICSDDHLLKLPFQGSFNLKTYFHFTTNNKEISFGFIELLLKNKMITVFHVTSIEIDVIHVFSNLFLLPFLRHINRMEPIIPSFKVKLDLSYTLWDAVPSYKRAQLFFKNGQFYVNFNEYEELLNSSCLVLLPALNRDNNIVNAEVKLNAIITQYPWCGSS